MHPAKLQLNWRVKSKECSRLSAQLIKNYPTFNFIQRERCLCFSSIGIFLLSFKDERLEPEYQADARRIQLDLEYNISSMPKEDLVLLCRIKPVREQPGDHG